MIFEATKKGRTKKISPAPLFGAVVGSGIRDPESEMNKNQNPG
jgi:hypothetical protein